MINDNLYSLIEYKELNDTDWYEQSLSQLIISIIWLNTSGLTVKQIQIELSEIFSIRIRSYRLREILSTLEEEKRLIRSNNTYSLSISERERCSILDEQNPEDERFAQESYETLFNNYGFLNILPWKKFKQEVLFPLVNNVGNSFKHLFADDFTQFETSLTKVIQQLPKECQVQINLLIIQYFKEYPINTNRYLYKLLGAQMVASASGLPSSIIQQIQQRANDSIEFRFFIDSNVIYSLLGLHSNPFDEAVEEFLTLINSSDIDGIKVEIVVTGIILNETIHSLESKKGYYINKEITSNIIQAIEASDSNNILPAFGKIHNGAAVNMVDYLDFCSKNLSQILIEKGIILIDDEEDISKLNHQNEVNIDIEKQIEFQERIKGIEYRYNHEKLVETDVFTWHYLDSKRNRFEEFISAKNWFITENYSLIAFDRYKRSRSSGSKKFPRCITPLQVFQILNFFIPRDEQCFEKMLETVALPFFSTAILQEVENQVQKIINEILKYDGYQDFSPSLIQSAIGDEVLRKTVSLKDNNERITEELENLFAKEYVNKEKESEENKLLLKQSEEEKNILEEKVNALEQKVNELTENATILETEQKEKLREEEERKKQRTGAWIVMGFVSGFTVLAGYLLTRIFIHYYSTVFNTNQVGKVSCFIVALLLLLGLIALLQFLFKTSFPKTLFYRKILKNDILRIVFFLVEFFIGILINIIQGVSFPVN